jgi:tRNA(Ile)-lysidine synthase
MNALTIAHYNGGATAGKKKMLKALKNSLTQNYKWEPAEVVVVAVSGGMDSLVLLHALHKLSEPLNIVLHTATFDHQLRGEESAADVVHVRNCCELWNIPLTTGSADVAALASAQRVSLEVAARRARYQFLAEVSIQVGARRIAVAHHQSDQAETVLMHILRGTGQRGLQGMKFVSPCPNAPQIEVIRPMLGIPRTDIQSYATEHNLPYRTDSSNTDTSILRNRIRLEALPYLRNFNPNLEQGLSQLSQLMMTNESFLHHQTQQQAIAATQRTADGQFTLSRHIFRNLHPALQHRWIIWVLEQLGKYDSVEYGHVLHAARLAAQGRHGSQAEFSGGVSLHVRYNEVVIGFNSAKATDSMPGGLDSDLIQEVRVPTEIAVHSGSLRFRWQSKAMTPKHAQLSILEGATLTLRIRQPGDRFRPQGLHGHSQKLKDWFINHKIPQYWRDSIPLLWVGSELAAIFVYPHWHIAQPFLPQDVSQHVLFIEFWENS